MFDSALRAVALATLLAAPLAGQAQAHEARGAYSQVLDQLPADAPPGDCYARVRVPGEPAGPPPMAEGARWVLNPGPPGSPGPVWCLVPTGPVVMPAPPVPDRYGWIRVLCDTDATPERIGRIQRRLHERGDYRGEVNGRYDTDTAQAVARYQHRAHIDHGGYLSLETLQSLDSDRGADDGYQSQSGYSYSSRYESSSAYGSGGYAYGYQGAPSYAPPSYGPQPYAAPCCVAPPQPQPQPYPCCQTYGYHPVPAYASDRFSPVQNGWLTWRGKSEF